MNKWLLTRVLVITGGFITSPAYADFQWTSPWQVTSQEGFSSLTPGFDTGTGGSASGDATANASFAGAFASSGTTLTRTFNVTGSAAGWRMDLTNDYNGVMQTLHGYSTAQFFANIDTTTVINRFHDTGSSPIVPFFDSSFPAFSVIIPDGTHSITVSNRVTALVAPPPFAPPGSFASSQANVIVTVNATPVPEPDTLALVAGVTLLGAFVRRRIID